MLGRSFRVSCAALLVYWMPAASVWSQPKPPASAPAQLKKLADPAFVGNWYNMFNPARGTSGTQQITVDIDEFGHYLAFYMGSDVAPVDALLEASNGKWTLTGTDGKLIDQGTYQPLGPMIQTSGPSGSGFWTRYGDSKQASLRKLGIKPREADVTPFIAEAVKVARQSWQKDAILVELQTAPNKDGTVDLTQPGGNVTFRFYSPSTKTGCWGNVGNYGDITVTPAKEAISTNRFPIPTNVISLQRAMELAAPKAPNKRFEEATLWGAGTDADLRQFCWVLRHDSGVVAIDAVLEQATDYRKFVDGDTRSTVVPFSRNTVTATFMHWYGPDEGIGAMWFTKHAVFLDGIDDAIVVQVPWRMISTEEIDKNATRDEKGEKIHHLDSGRYPLGRPVELTPAQRQRLAKHKEAIEIGCAPFVVESEQALSKYPAEIKQRIKKQLESYWRATGGR